MAADALFSKVHQIFPFVFVSLLRQQQRIQVVWISLFSDAHALYDMLCIQFRAKAVLFFRCCLAWILWMPLPELSFPSLLIKVNCERVIVLTAIAVPKFRHQFHQNKIRNTCLVFMSFCIDVVLWITWLI